MKFFKLLFNKIYYIFNYNNYYNYKQLYKHPYIIHFILFDNYKNITHKYIITPSFFINNINYNYFYLNIIKNIYLNNIFSIHINILYNNIIIHNLNHLLHYI